MTRIKFSITNKIIIATIFSILLFSISPNAQEVRKISYNKVNIDVVIDKPSNDSVDVLIAYPGTVMSDDKILDAAKFILTKVKEITNRKDMMIVSVAYPQENRLMGDSIREAEAALLWVKEKAGEELGKKIKKIYLVGHSQGGYVVTRLNTMHATDGVIANAPGPLNLVFRCGLEENNRVPNGVVCGLLKETYGTTLAKPASYMERSLLNFTEGYKSDILFVQGLQDTRIQMASWSTFKQKVTDCANCKKRQFVEIANSGHPTLFSNSEAKKAYNDFINR